MRERRLRNCATGPARFVAVSGPGLRYRARTSPLRARGGPMERRARDMRAAAGSQAGGGGKTSGARRRNCETHNNCSLNLGSPQPPGPGSSSAGSRRSCHNTQSQTPANEQHAPARNPARQAHRMPWGAARPQESEIWRSRVLEYRSTWPASERCWVSSSLLESAAWVVSIRVACADLSRARTARAAGLVPSYCSRAGGAARSAGLVAPREAGLAGEAWVTPSLPRGPAP